VTSSRQLLNGSFTTSKSSPGDIDIAVEVPLDGDIERRLMELSPVIQLLQGPEMKGRFKCDAYPIYVLPVGTKDYDRVTLDGVRYWTKWFGRTRDGIRKGRVWASVGGLR
jgi:hypothetical protein